jgi:hypothetical protein
MTIIVVRAMIIGWYVSFNNLFLYSTEYFIFFRLDNDYEWCCRHITNSRRQPTTTWHETTGIDPGGNDDSDDDNECNNVALSPRHQHPPTPASGKSGMELHGGAMMMVKG